MRSNPMNGGAERGGGESMPKCEGRRNIVAFAYLDGHFNVSRQVLYLSWFQIMNRKIRKMNSLHSDGRVGKVLSK